MTTGEIDVARARADTPGCARVTHLNNAGASLMPAPVLEAVITHLRLEADIGGYEAAARAAGRVAHTYEAVAGLIGCRPSEVAVVENATRGWDMAAYGLALAPGDRVLVATAEYASNLIALHQIARRTGASIEVVPDDDHGQLSVTALEAMLDERVKLVAITHVPTSNGLVNPAEEVGRLARAAGVTFLLDACQSVGQMPVDVDTLGCDMLAATGRKFLRGPRGTGFLYVRQGLIESLEPPMLDLHSAEWSPAEGVRIRSDARRFESWESSYAGKIGLGVAVDYARGLGLEAIEERVVSLAGSLRRRLAEVPGVTVHDRGQRRCGIVTFAMAGRQPEEILGYLSANDLNVSVSLARQSPLDLPPRHIASLVRASVHYFNVESELDRLCALLGA